MFAYYVLLWVHIWFSCARFSFSVLSQEIGWEEPLCSDLFCVGGTYNVDSIIQYSRTHSSWWCVLRVKVSSGATYRWGLGTGAVDCCWKVINYSLIILCCI